MCHETKPSEDTKWFQYYYLPLFIVFGINCLHTVKCFQV